MHIWTRFQFCIQIRRI